MTKEEKEARKQLKKELKIEKKEKYYQEKFGVSYKELIKKNNKVEDKRNKQILNLIMKTQRNVFIITFIFIALMSAIGFFPAYLFQKYNTYLTLSNWDGAIKVVICYIIAQAFTSGINMLCFYIQKRAVVKTVYQIRGEMNKKILSTKYETFKLLNTGEILQKLSVSLNEYINASLNLIGCFCEMFESVVFAAYSLIIAPWISLILLGFGFVRWVISFNYQKQVLQIRRKRTFKINDKISGVNNETIRGMHDVKLLNIKDIILEKIFKLNKNQLNNSYEKLSKDFSLEIILEIIQYLKNIAFFLLSVIFLRDGVITLGTVLMLYTYRGYFNTLFTKITSIDMYKNIKFVNGNRLCEILDDNKFQLEKFGTKELRNPKGRIEFKDVTFSYKDIKEKKEKVLDKINFVVEENKCVGLVGESGSGKSTIINLIPRLYDVDSGKILLDGINIKSLTEDSLRGNIAVVSQNPYIFNLSFAENLRIIKKDATDEELMDVAKKVNLDKIITERREGLNTKLGEGGLQLSGGQRQRLAIARALLRDSKVIIFDEATSALDNENQNEIQKIIKKLQKDHTIIVIAHRLSTIVNCDKLIFIQKGKKIAEGKHKDLMKNCKEYKELYKYESKL